MQQNDKNGFVSPGCSKHGPTSSLCWSNLFTHRVVLQILLTAYLGTFVKLPKADLCLSWGWMTEYGRIFYSWASHRSMPSAPLNRMNSRRGFRHDRRQSNGSELSGSQTNKRI